MSQQARHLYEFGPFALDASARVLMRQGEVLPLAPKTVDLLLALVESSGRVVSKGELIQRVWPDSFVEEANLSHHVFVLRKALGEEKNGPRYIETVPRRGYRFVASVNESFDEGEAVVVAERTRSRIVVEEMQEGECAADGSTDVPLDQSNMPAEAAPVGRQSKRMTLAAIGLCLAVIGLALAAYTWVAGRGGQARKSQAVRSIAVLPFKPLISGQRDEYLEIGMADTLINRLSGIKDVVVRPTSAVRQYTDPQQDAVAAGRALQVESVLDGSLQRLGDRIRVSVRLLSVNDGTTLWADRFDERFTDIFAVQDSISKRVAGLLAVKLTGDDRARLVKRYTENPEAYQFYLRGRYHWNKRTAEGFRKGIEYFDQAIQLDPSYALAYSGEADCYALLANSSAIAPGDGFPKARAAATHALEIDDALAEAHTSLAFVLYQFDRDYAGAEREFKRAIELNPNYATTHHWYADYLSLMGRADEALREIQLAQQNDPLSLVINAELGDYLQNAGQSEKAIEHLQRTLEMDPNFIRTHQTLGTVYLKKGMFDQAVTEFQRARQLYDNPRNLMSLGYAYAVAGRQAEAHKIIEELRALSKGRYVSPLYFAAIYAGLGENERALSLIEKAREQNENLDLIKTDEQFRRLLSDPAFAERLRRLGLSN